MNPLEPRIEVTRSFAMKVNLGNYQSADFFASAKHECALTEAEEISELVYGFVKGQVLKSAAEFRSEYPKVFSDEGAMRETIDASTYAFREKARELNQRAQQNPFQVSAEPAPEVVHAVQSSGAVPVTAESPSGSPAAAPPVVAEETGTSSQGAGGLASSPGGPPSPPPVGGEAQAPPTDAAPKRRGRPPTKSSPEASGANGDTGTSNGGAVPPEGGQHVQSGEAVPAIIGDVLQEQVTQAERMYRVVDVLAKGEPRKSPPWDAARAKLQQFMLTFLPGQPRPAIQTDLSTPPNDRYERALPLLESLASQYGPHILAEPQKTATMALDGYGKLVRHIDKWPDAVKGAAIQTAIACYPDCCYDLIEYLDMKPPVTGDGDLLVFLSVVRRSREIATKVREFSASTKRPIVEILRGIDLAKCSEGDILGRLMGGAAAGGTGDLWQ